MPMRQQQLENQGREQKGAEKLRWSEQGWNRLCHKYDDDDDDDDGDDDDDDNNNNNNMG